MTESPQRAPQRRGRRELLVQMQINRGNATAGGPGTNVAASAMMSVLVTLDGDPVSGINLPAGWTLRDGFNVRPGGCRVTVTEFVNQGNGLYNTGMREEPEPSASA